MKKIFLLIGTDKRQKYLKELLEQKGYFAEHYSDIEGVDISRYDVILLPVADSRHYYEKIKAALRENQYVFGCNFKPSHSTAVRAAEAAPFEALEAGGRLDTVEKFPVSERLIEYLSQEQTALQNAAATAEGAIAEAIINSDVNLCGSASLVLGYGRCGRQIADRLRGLHSTVSVAEQDEVLCAEAESCGFNIISESLAVHLQRNGKKYQFIFNTIPKAVLDENTLRALSRECVIIDIASKPGGVDYKYCEKHGIHAVHALGLPGKYAPKTSAKILFNVIEKAVL